LVKWEILGDEISKESWDKELSRFEGFTLYQCYAWGEHNRSLGWVPFRWVARENGREIVAMVQALYKPYKLGIGMLWSSGGPVGDVSVWGEGLRQVALESTGAKGLYYRFFSNRECTQEDEESLESLGWRRCAWKLRSGLSMKLYLDREPEELRRGFSRNWRHNLNRSEKAKLRISQWINPDIDEIVAVYQSMETYKGLKEQFSRQELESIFQNLAEQIVLYRCDNEIGQLVALRGCGILNQCGWDLFASTSVAGRGLYASYALLWEILQHCQREGVKEYDMMGIDPIKNLGVANFKKGTGANLIEYLGEWEWATNRILEWGANLAVRWVRSNA
jgi:hypothetical protein